MPEDRLKRLRDLVPQWAAEVEDGALRKLFERTVGAFLTSPDFDSRLSPAENWKTFMRSILAKGEMLSALNLNVDAGIRSNIFSGEERMFATLAVVDLVMPRHRDVLGYLERERAGLTLNEMNSFMARLWHAAEVAEHVGSMSEFPDGAEVFSATVHALREHEHDPEDVHARREMQSCHRRYLEAEDQVRSFILEAVAIASPSWMPGEPIRPINFQEARQKLVEVLGHEVKRMMDLAARADEEAYDAVNAWRSALSSFLRSARASRSADELQVAVRQWNVNTNGLSSFSDLHIPFERLERIGIQTSFSHDELYEAGIRSP